MEKITIVMDQVMKTLILSPMLKTVVSVIDSAFFTVIAASMETVYVDQIIYSAVEEKSALIIFVLSHVEKEIGSVLEL